VLIRKISDLNHVMKNEYNKGTKVRLTSEWNEGDTQVFIVVGEDEGKGRVDIAPENSDLTMAGIETVKTFMIERI
jgi:hypothetical protein